MVRNFFRYSARIVILVAGVGIVWLVINWIASAGSDEPKGVCAQPGLRCTLCQAWGRSDCNAKPLAGCPGTAVDYVGSFPRFKEKLSEQKKATAEWTRFRKEMEAIQNRSSVELCRGNIDRMKKVEAEISIAEACPGEPASAAGAKPSGTTSDEVAMLMKFRDCSEAKSQSLGTAVKERKALQVGEETAQLHSMNKDITKITTDSIELLVEFREQSNEAKQVKCWLRGRIRDCGL